MFTEPEVYSSYQIVSPSIWIWARSSSGSPSSRTWRASISTWSNGRYGDWVAGRNQCLQYRLVNTNECKYVVNNTRWEHRRRPRPTRSQAQRSKTTEMGEGKRALTLRFGWHTRNSSPTSRTCESVEASADSELPCRLTQGFSVQGLGLVQKGYKN